ncbi:MAG TPA: hypothetical protein VN999_17735, partial [Thermoanaerobaculia bacterium]|nr:hypothetical protein [Thermoanaerobaculia bacterium]
NAVQALLLTLARQPNGADAWEKAQPWMYYPSAPDIFQDLAEAEWSREHADYRARERIGYAFAWIAEKWPANEVLTATCRQWLRFVHPDGIREGIGGRPRLDAEPELRARIAAVQPLTEEHGIAPVPVVAANLLGLADLALLAMCEVCLNGGPRELHLPALAAWAVSNAVMGRMRNGEEARWVVRFGGEGFWPGLTDFAAIFAAQGEPILHRAAALLLRLEGSTDAWERARQLDPPMPAAPVPAEPNQDDAGRELSLLEAAWAAGRLADRALDPQLPLDALRWRYQDLLRLIDLAEVSTGRQRTSSDLALEQADAALSRTAPHAYASFARRVVDFILGQVESRTDLRTEILAKHFLILSRRQLARARTLLPGLERERQSRPDAMGGAVWDLAEVVLAALPAGPSQLRFLLGRLDTADAADWEDLLAPLPPPAVRSMLRRLSRASGVQRRRMLYFPWREAPALSALERQALTAAACDPEMGTVAGSVPQHARDPELLLTAVRNGWVDDERLSRILAQQPWARVALAAAPPEVQLHLGVEAASWAVCERGLEGAAVRQWTGDLDRALWHPPAQQAISAGGRIAVETVTAAMRRAPELTDAWIAALTGQTDLSMRLTNIHFSLASALLLALLNNDDDRAVAAFSRLLHPQAFVFTVTDQPSGLPSVWFLPFKERDTAATRQVARLLFDQAFTDDALSRLAYAASLHGRLDALVDQLEPPPTPDNTLAEARVVALLALAPLSARAERAIERFAANATGWRPDVVAWARTQLRQDSRARQWFRRFLEDPSTVQAWAAFRLFLHTVDRRGLLWLGDELERAKGTPGYEARRRHLILNRSQVGRAIKAQADQAAKHLCGHPVPFDIVPWKRGWRL